MARYSHLRAHGPLHRHMLSAVALAAAALTLSGCSAEPAPRAEADVQSADPAGVALPLSIGGQVAAEGEDDSVVAINCSAALGLTAERLASMTNDPRSAEIALIRRAERYFAKQAGGSVEAAIAQRRSEKSDEATEQAQLAIACLRRFGDEVSAQSGAATQE